MTNDLVLSVQRDITLDILNVASHGGAIMHASRMFNTANAEQAAAIMLKGYELGLPMTAAFDFIHNIQGKLSLSPAGALALIHASGQLKTLTFDEQPDSCTVVMTRSNGLSYTSKFTLAMAAAAGLTKQGGNWDKYPANMLRWRAIGYCADVLFGDILAGMKTADQFGANINEAGEVIEGVVIE